MSNCHHLLNFQFKYLNLFMYLVVFFLFIFDFKNVV